MQKILIVCFLLWHACTDALGCLEDKDFDISNLYLVLQTLFRDYTDLFSSKPLLVFRTTLPIGSCDNLKYFIESTFDLVEGTDFYIVFVPERLAEGVAVNEETNLPKIIGAYCDEGFDKASSLFSTLPSDIIRVNSPKTAEFCKLTDNSFRNTLFSFSNELAMWCTHNKVDAHEVISAVSSNYPRNKIPSPGFVSGYCLGKDPYIFELGFGSFTGSRDFQSLWYYGRRINDHLVRHVVMRVIELISNSLSSVDKTHLLILGLSFKNDIDDYRMSHSFDIIDELLKYNPMEIASVDPYLRSNRYTQIPDKYHNNSSLKWFESLDESLLLESDVLVVSHKHKVFIECLPFIEKTLAKRTRPLIIYDGWNIFRSLSKHAMVNYFAIGYSSTSYTQSVISPSSL